MTPEELEQSYQDYLKAGTAANHALSLQTATYLNNLIDELGAKRVLDIGSGFSTFVTRSHPGVDCWTVEEDSHWRDVTKSYLEQHDLDSGHIFSGLDFRGAEAGKFDLVLHDSFGQVGKMQRLRRAAAMVKPGGVLIVDDGHFPALHRCCRVWAQIQGYPFADLKDLTDEYGRFPMRLDVTQEAKQQNVSVVMAPLRGMVCLDKPFMAFLKLASGGWPIIDLPYAMTPFAREKCAEHLLGHPEYTHVVMLDQDHNHPPDLIHRLAQRADEDRGKWVIAALNYRRGPPFDPVGYWENGQGQIYTKPPAQWTPEIQTVDVVGLSAAILARECFEAFGPPWFDMDWSKAGEGARPGEDTTFSKHAKQAGVKLWVDPDICSPHCVVDEVDRQYHERWVREHQDEIDEDGNLTIDKRR